MNPTNYEQISHSKQNNNMELEAAGNVAFYEITQGARDVFKNVKHVAEIVEDQSSLVFSDIFGQSIARDHIADLKATAGKENSLSHLDAANHYTRRALDYSRNALGDDAATTQDLEVELSFAERRAADAKHPTFLSIDAYLRSLPRHQ